MALDIDRITNLTEQVSQGSKLLAQGNEKDRATLAMAAWKLVQALEKPQETFYRLWLLDTTTRAVARVASDLKLTKHLPDEEDKAVGSAELATKTGADQAILIRLLNHLAATGVVNEAGPDLFYANALTRHLAEDTVQDGFEFYDRGMAKALAVLPKYLAEHRYRDITDGLDCPWQMALDTKLHSFEYIQQDSEFARLFKSAVLSQAHVHRAHWEDEDFYPVQERLIAGLEPDGVVLVDVGGGMGLDLTNFHNSHPEPATSRLVLQDVETVIGTMGELPSRIEKFPHDFFQEQPVKGARAYYLHRVFHDWSDEKCRTILLALKPALAPGYSKVLVQESIVPAQGATWLTTAADLLMMCSLAGRERTEAGFRELFESVGMKVTGFYTRAPGEESLVEAMLCD